MLLGKRPRPPIMKRTTSMSGGMAVHTQTTNLEAQIQAQAQAQAHDQIILISDSEDNIKDPHQHQGILLPHQLPPTPTNNHPHTHNNNPSHLIHTPHFLRTCGLCNSRLAPGRDIYMYRGDTAFCSLECREQQMKQDERKEKWKMASNKEEHRRASPPSTAKASTKTETGCLYLN